MYAQQVFDVYREISPSKNPAYNQSQIDHQKLQSFVYRLELDIQKEAEYVQSKLGRAQSLQPHIVSDGDKAKLKVKGPDGEEKTYEIPILTGKLESRLIIYRQHGGEALGYQSVVHTDWHVPV